MSADATAPGAVPGPGDDASPVERAVWDALDEVEDPHLPLSLVEMGMIYDVAVDRGAATVEMSFPCMGCPAYEFIHEDIEAACREAGATDAAVDVVWDPVWTKEMMPEHAREALRESGIGI